MSSSPETTIGALLERVRAGDEMALGDLLREYEPKIRLTARYLIRPILRRYLDSIDVAQSVQFDLMRGLRQGRFVFGDSEAFLALAVTVVRRKVAQHWRHLQHERRLRVGSLEHDGPWARRSAPEDPAHTVQQHEDIQTFMKFLDPTERRLVELRLMGLSTEDAAAAMQCEANVLRVRLSRLRKRLREHGTKSDWI